MIPKGDRLIVEMPGGGGIGAPESRDPARVAADVRAGLVTAEAAARDYKVALREDLSVDDTYAVPVSIGTISRGRALGLALGIFSKTDAKSGRVALPNIKRE